MTRKHYKRMAEIIAAELRFAMESMDVKSAKRRIYIAGIRHSANMFCRLAHEFNPRFDARKFMVECGLER